MPNMTISQAGINLTRDFEGLRLTAYRDPRNIWTIGYGHTGPEVHGDQVITQQQAIALLTADMHAAVAVVNRLVKAPVSQSQFDALVDFAYNAGVGALATSELLRLVNRNDFAGAAAEFGKWVHAGGVVLPGLVKRRQAERELFEAA